MSENLLSSEISPYLLQHKDNPVHWRPWGAEALAEAERLDKPLIVSVGYAACHWCHVMAHESFEDAETAALMNELFVSVKVDREERPDVDAWIQTALQGIGEGGGWPATVFLTPRGEPFTGGTYYPKEPGYGRPAFKDVLRQVSEVYAKKPELVRDNAEKLAQLFARIGFQNRSGSLSIEELEKASSRVAQSFDIFWGGLSGAPKFPQVPLIEMLWRSYLRTAAMPFRQLAETTLDMMCMGGIYDHLGGGFARYSTDERWLVPHFEKMLYDNAQLVDVLTLVWQHERNPLYRARVEETVSWLLSDMLVDGAAFAASIDADSEGEEGKYYLWTDAEISDALAGTFGERFKVAYGIRPEGNIFHGGAPDGRNVLNRLNGGEFSDADEALFATQRQMLRAARTRRVVPARDDKVLADWNGLAITALAHAGLAMQRTEWLDAAERAYNFICDKLSTGDKLFHAYRNGQQRQAGFSDDYAAMIQAALALWEATGKSAYLDRARAWTQTLDEEFWDSAQGGYVFSAVQDDAISLRVRNALDTHVPSTNGSMIASLARLYFATGQTRYGERAQQILSAFFGDLGRQYLHMGTYINSFDFITTGLQIVIAGSRNDIRTQDMVDAVLARSLPNRLLTVVEPGNDLPANHPASGKTMQGGMPTAYVCQQQSCSPPITSPVSLAQALTLPAPRTRDQASPW